MLLELSFYCFLILISYRWKVEEWGTCQQCGNGVQFRQVQCIIPILESQAAQDTTGFVVDNISLATSAVLVVKDKQCMGERPQSVQGCHKVCSQGKHY